MQTLTPLCTPTTPTTNTPDRPTPIHPLTRTILSRTGPTQWGEPTVIGAPQRGAKPPAAKRRRITGDCCGDTGS